MLACGLMIGQGDDSSGVDMRLSVLLMAENFPAVMVRYSIMRNFLGMWAITMSVGYNNGGLLMGIQFISHTWSDATLHLAYSM